MAGNATTAGINDINNIIDTSGIVCSQDQLLFGRFYNKARAVPPTGSIDPTQIGGEGASR